MIGNLLILLLSGDRNEHLVSVPLTAVEFLKYSTYLEERASLGNFLFLFIVYLIKTTCFVWIQPHDSFLFNRLLIFISIKKAYQNTFSEN